MSIVKTIIANKSDKQALQDWQEFLDAIKNSTTVDLNETEEAKQARIRRLEKPGNEEEWFAYYFPSYCSSAPAPFHTASTRRIMRTNRLYQARGWARGLSKSTRRMFEVLYLGFVKKLRINCILVSKNEGNAIRLLSPYRANLQANQRLINDYGPQEGLNKWAEEEFVTRKRWSFRAVGMGQNPRGARMEELRVNVLIFDDADDEEVCDNPDRLDKAWKWVERAAIPTVDISSDYYIFFDNNIIAEDCLALRAHAKAQDAEIINIRGADGKSVWPQKNSEADIDFMLSQISYESAQAEYFNNPMSNGKAFPEMHWGKCPPMASMPFIILYADPGTSNQDKPSTKSRENASHKAIFAMGYDGAKLYVYKGFVDAMRNSDFISRYYQLYQYCMLHKAKVIMCYVENNSLQNPFYEQVLLPLIHEAQKEFGFMLPITPDAREKPEKWTRIEGNLEPLNRFKNLILNEAEAADNDMQRLEVQFKKAKPTSKRLDGPDCIEGGYYYCKRMASVAALDNAATVYKRPRNPKRLY